MTLTAPLHDGAQEFDLSEPGAEQMAAGFEDIAISIESIALAVV